LDEVKAETEGPSWGWYPFKMLPGFVYQLDGLLTGDNRLLLERPADPHVADIGAADGDLAFFLESIGLKVDIIDGGDPSVRDLRLLAPHILKDALGSAAEIHGVDLDREFELPRQYELVFFLGVLYHLRNPFLTLQTLARSARHCILSTRVAHYVQVPGRFGRTRLVNISGLPVAYLVDTYEINEFDSSNYWVFSEVGLRRLFQRAGWSVLDFTVAGNPSAEPASEEEARAWCLLRSEVFEMEGEALPAHAEERDSPG
jgi:hypothetical protein